ncbi:MAG: peptidoglycan-binding domain-containing protein [Candidatus Vogelbacteria bacterium]|nr:peptidoglycan-binding domain-containing protein [Candidatus Vogelbacteria bacterium]
MHLKFVSKVARILAVILVLALAIPAQAATGTLTAAETVANVVIGTDDQTAALASTTPNITEVKATTTLRVAAIPANAETITIGSCVVTFLTGASTTAGVKCIGNAVTLGVGDGSNATTTAGLAATLATLNNAWATTSGATTTSLDFSRGSTTTSVAVQTSASTTEVGGKIIFVDGTTNDIVLMNDQAGVAPRMEVDTVTIAGTVDVGDTYSIVSTSTALNTASLFTVVTGNTKQLIADGIRNQMWASAASTTVGFTVATGTNKLIFSARRIGYGNTVVASTTNYAGVSQKITFTPASVTASENYIASINSRDYSYYAASGDTVAIVVAALATAMAADPVATCVNTGGTTVTCTAITPGTAYTAYTTRVADAPSVSSSNSGGGGGGGGYTPPIITVPAEQSVNIVAPSRAARNLFTSTLAYGSQSSQVKALQNKLVTEGFLKAKATGYFGQATVAAVKAYQKAHGVRVTGNVGPATRTELNKPTGDARNALIIQIQTLLQQIKDLQAQMKRQTN